MKSLQLILLTMFLSSASAQTDGTLDLSFDPGTGFSGPLYPIVEKVLVQPDQKILVGGSFIEFNGFGRGRIARLRTNGSLDLLFSSGNGFDGTVRDMALQPDGKIIVVGDFASYDGEPIFSIARLHPDGMLDTTFRTYFSVAQVNSVALQDDGKVLVGGYFQSGVMRFHSDGSQDMEFALNSQEVGYTNDIVIQPDGKIVAVGWFSHPNETKVIRLEPDGSLDTGFNVLAIYDLTVHCLALETDGQLLVGGAFTTYAHFHRLNSDGSIAGFSQDILYPDYNYITYVGDILVQADTKIVLVGRCLQSSHHGPCRSIKRINSDGSYDGTFDDGYTGAGSIVTVGQQSDGKLIVGGDFQSIHNEPRGSIARLNSTITGVDEHELTSLSVSPNPSSGLFHLHVDKPTNIQVFNSLGKQILSQTVSMSTDIDLSSSPSGIYLLQASFENQIATVNLVKQ